MKPLIRRLAGFSGLPLLAMVTPFLLLPIVARLLGVEGWSSFAVGQTVGVFASTAIMVGWHVSGPARLALATNSTQRAELYDQALWSRILIATLILPVAITITALLSRPSHVADAVLMTIAMSLLGLTPAWYCIGLGSSRLLAVYETAPRLVATVVSALLLALTGQVWIYPLLLIAASVGALVAFSARVVRAPRNHPTLRALVRALCHQAPLAASNVVGALYTATPVPIAVALSSQGASAAFASAERLYRFSRFTITSTANAFQSWVLEPDATRPRRRQLAVIGTHSLLGLAGAIALALLGPWATGILFGRALAASTGACVYFGAAFLFSSVATPLIRNLIVPTGRARQVLVATTFGAAVGVPLMFVLHSAIGTEGVAAALAISELIVLMFLVRPAVSAFTRLVEKSPSEWTIS